MTEATKQRLMDAGLVIATLIVVVSVLRLSGWLGVGVHADGPEACVLRASGWPEGGQPAPANTPTDADATDKPMQPIEFKSAQAELSEAGLVVLALFDGEAGNSTTVLLLSCEKETAIALLQSLRSVVKPQTGQSHDESLRRTVASLLRCVARHVPNKS